MQITYDYPFNERIRILLRLEDLYEKYTFFLAQDHALEHHMALVTLFDIVEVASRTDLKADLRQELDRQKQILAGFKANPDVQEDLLDKALKEIEDVSTALINTYGKPGQNIRDSEWLTSIRGRTGIPGALSKFDLPAYYAWQHLPADVRRGDIKRWFAPLKTFFDAVCLTLKLLRDSGEPFKVIAYNGCYQQMLQGRAYQMVRLRVKAAEGVVPAISANKYTLWIRFSKQNGTEKLRPYEKDVPCELTLC